MQRPWSYMGRLAAVIPPKPTTPPSPCAISLPLKGSRLHAVTARATPVDERRDRDGNVDGCRLVTERMIGWTIRNRRKRGEEKAKDRQISQSKKTTASNDHHRSDSLQTAFRVLPCLCNNITNTTNTTAIATLTPNISRTYDSTNTEKLEWY